MESGKTVLISYLRVSTVRQGQSGLGIEAQRAAVAAHLAAYPTARIAGEFVEVESGKRNDRPELAKAIATARLHNGVLVIAKLDRLSRDAHFLLGLQKSGIQFVACDMPHADSFSVGILALVAQKEREMISARTKAALAAAKARGVALGGNRGKLHQIIGTGVANSVATRRAKAQERARDVLPTIEEIAASGASLHRIAAELTARGIPTPRGGTWTATAVRRARARIAEAA
ncbi:MAG: recombinase family protein [Beijerinckiaceae bacterium]